MVPDIKPEATASDLQPSQQSRQVLLMHGPHGPQYQINQSMVLAHSFKLVLFAYIPRQPVPRALENPEQLRQ